MFAKVALPAPFHPVDKLLDYAIPEDLIDWVQPGSLVEIPFRNGKSWGLVFETTPSSDVPDEKLKYLSSVLLEKPVFESARLEFLKDISRYYIYPIGEVCETAIPAVIRKSSSKNLKKYYLKIIEDLSKSESPRPSPHTLNKDQENALQRLNSLKQGEALLWGITGSGKTELYLRLAENCLKKNQTVLVLVPEISLTPQLIERFQSRFGETLAVFHSQQSDKETRQAWLRTQAQKVSIVIGARSALFAPLKNIGLIILDEEHDSSYKQDDRLRYDARIAARNLAALLKIPIIFGSATPSAEILNRALKKEIVLAKLEARASLKAELPEIKLVDLKKSFAVENKDPLAFENATRNASPVKEEREDLFLSPELKVALEETLAQDKQALLFLNRRGLGSSVYCSKCGEIPQCPVCSVALVPHDKSLDCHYCGFRDFYRNPCAHCEAPAETFHRTGIGTEAIQKLISYHFPQAVSARLDRDEIENIDDLNQTLDRFRKKEIQILVGTQMMAKGHDFPDVTLVGMILADVGLSVPDFRTHEKLFQLLLQVSGRAGRHGDKGRVLIQTLQPEHSLYQALIKYTGLNSYSEFLEADLQKRRLLDYPPFAELALLRVDGPDIDQVIRTSEKVAEALRKANSPSLLILGPTQAPIFKIRNRYRYQILLKSKSTVVLEKAAAWMMGVWFEKRLEKEMGCRLSIDRDPQNML